MSIDPAGEERAFRRAGHRRRTFVQIQIPELVRTDEERTPRRRDERLEPCELRGIYRSIDGPHVVFGAVVRPLQRVQQDEIASAEIDDADDPD